MGGREIQRCELQEVFCNMTESLSEAEKTILWILGALRQMQIWGLIGGTFEPVTPRGLAVWDQIDKTDAPSGEQIAEALHALFGKASDAKENLLLCEFRDNREQMERLATQ